MTPDRRAANGHRPPEREEGLPPLAAAALALWALNFATIAGWAKLFFGERNLGGSLADVGVQLLAAGGYVAAAARVDPTAAALGVPYAAWSAFGSALDEEVWRLNTGRA